MKYSRPEYPGPEGLKDKAISLYGFEMRIPKIDTPITPLENFKRAAARKNPLWVPNALTDVHDLYLQFLGEGRQIGSDYRRKTTEDYRFKDWFDVDWTWCVDAGGAVTTPGTAILDDVTKWESVVKFPVLSEWDWKAKAENFMKNEYVEGKVIHIDLGPGCIQRLVSVLGGYQEAMLALALEPEAVSDFFARIADFFIELVDHLMKYYPANMFTIHDDWGTERDTFFSPKMMEELVFEPTKRIIDHIKQVHGCMYMQHTCGNVTRFIPYMIDMNTDFLQIQRRAVDIPLMKKKYGDKIGFNTGIELPEANRKYNREEMLGLIRNTVDIYGKGGGFYAMMFEADPALLWDYLYELYCYSREAYEMEQAG